MGAKGISIDIVKLYQFLKYLLNNKKEGQKMIKLKMVCLASLVLLAVAPIKIQSVSAVVSLPENCNTHGAWEEETKTCVLNQDLDEGVEIKENDIILNCDGHSINGLFKKGYGLYLNDRSGVSITNCAINNFSRGIYLRSSDNNNLINNTVSNNFEGIYLRSSDSNNLINNTVSNNFEGIYLSSSDDNILTDNVVGSNKNFGIIHDDSSNSTFTGNIIFDNRYNFSLTGWGDDNFTNDIDKSNFVDGKPIYYLLDAENQVFDNSANAGLFYCINCNNITIKDLTFSKNKYGVFFWNTHNSKIENVVASDNKSSGIYFAYSSNNTITNSNILDNSSGIYFAASDNNTIIHNDILNNRYGIYPVTSANNTIIYNDISDNSEYGIYFVNNSNTNNSDSNMITDNYISNNSEVGICFRFSHNNIAAGNTLYKNNCGISIYSASGNKIYHNNFIANSEQPYSNSPRIFDNGYPIGGNYWSDYIGEDNLSGPSQDQPGGDGIGDVAYVFDDGRDNYPFTEENGWEGLANIPILSDFGQLELDKITPIIEGATVTENTVVFKALLDDSNNNQVRLQIELRKFNESFTGADDGGILNSDFIDAGNEATIVKSYLSNYQYHWRARAVNSQEGVSEWQEFEEAGNVDFVMKAVPLYTQVKSDYPSQEITMEWASKDYAKGLEYGCGSTIAGCGCAITSMIMVGRFYNIDNGINDSDANPGNINEWLKSNKGYSGPNLYWSKAVEYLGYIDKETKKKMARLSFNHFSVPFGNSRIDAYLNDEKPIVAKSDTYGHYFVVDGKIKVNNIDTYTVKDPYWYNTKTLNDTKNMAKKVQGYKNRFTKANLFSYLKAPKKIAASMQLHLASPAELVVTDPEGRKLGRDPISNTTYDEIPDSSYDTEEDIFSSDNPPAEIHETKIVYISNPINGLYDVQVIGTGAGNYTLSYLIYDAEGESKEIIQEGDIVQNDIQKFGLDYSTQDVQQTETYQIVDIDIKPHSKLNTIRIKSWGLTRVAILSDQFFDAREIAIDSVLLAGASPLIIKRMPPRWRFRDVDRDGDLDLILYFRNRFLNLDSSDTEAVLTGELNDGTLIKGSDSVKVIGRRHKK